MDRVADVILIDGMEVDERDALVRIDVCCGGVVGLLASPLPVDELDTDLADVDRAEADVVGEFLPDKKNRIIRRRRPKRGRRPRIGCTRPPRLRMKREKRNKTEKHSSRTPPRGFPQQQSP